MGQVKHIMLGILPGRTGEILTDKKVVVQCQSGARTIAASILQKNGYADWKSKL